MPPTDHENLTRYVCTKAKQSQFVVSQAIIPKIASGLRHLININDNDIHRILIENTPLTSSISGSA